MSFEYKVAAFTFKKQPISNDFAQKAVEDWLNSLGKEGWELVSIIPPGAYVFKRCVGVELSISEALLPVLGTSIKKVEE